MAEVRPFRGILFDPDVAGPWETVVAPPYDVISAADQSRLYELSPHNVVRIDLSREANRYEAAARLFREWRESGVLRRDDEPALYVHAQAFRLPEGRERERWGFFAQLHLEDFSSGIVRPHERTLPSAKADRLALQHACRANLSPIFGLYSIPEGNLADTLGSVGRPIAEFTDAAHVRHRFWRIGDSGLTRRLADRTIYIADGHHRYETALRYRDEMREATGRDDGRQPFDWVLAFLVNMEEPGVVVLPTHRVFRELPLEADALVARLRERFRVEEIRRSADDLLDAVRGVQHGERRIGLALRDLDLFVVLSTLDGDHDASLHGSTALRRLDVTLLHSIVLEEILGLDANHEHEEGRLEYVKDDLDAIARVERSEAAAAFIVNATRVDEMRAVCEAGETMPEKSTYFYPKIPTGLVFASLEDE